ncbi:hypothetical protein IP88_08400 [alpha proteobacterium AAP81b]|nr:hypothetical protein IP88_08400 [alpha proteobacterium AAP81b]
MPLFLLSVLVQVACVVHIIRTGRNQLWLWAVVLLPAAGSLAYFVTEILPGILGSPDVRALRVAAEKRLDPERELRDATDALSIAATAANEIRLGDALSELGRHSDAVPHYDRALASLPVVDRPTRYRLALALLESGDARRALREAEALPRLGETDGERAELLRARALEATGDTVAALALYAELADRIPGDEARCLYANLLITAGRKAEARTVLQEVAARARRLSRRQRAPNAAMYEWAASQLARLG